MNITCDGLVAKLGSMLNAAIFDPWQKSLFCSEHQEKEPLAAGNLAVFCLKFFHPYLLYMFVFMCSVPDIKPFA